MMIAELNETYNTIIREKWIKFDISIAVRSLLDRILADIWTCIDNGEWNLAVKLAQYTNEFAKLHGFYDWYNFFLEVRRCRDQIEMIVVAGRPSDSISDLSRRSIF